MEELDVLFFGGFLTERIWILSPSTIRAAETAAYLLKYDTVHGRLNKKVEIDKDDLIVDGKRIHVFQDRNPENLDWSAYGTEIVIESTGKLKDRESAGKHIRGTVKKVIITAPGKDEERDHRRRCE